MAEPGRSEVSTASPGVSAPAPKAAPGPDAPPAVEEITFQLDGRSVTARKGEVVISAAERAGVFIPRFCYHPRMDPVGMCRMCLVEVEGPRGATLQPSCFVTAAEGMQVVTTSEKVKKAQDGVLEFLLVNHPLDCPVCDKGGECPLQDQTLAYGPGESRFVEEKRHFEKPIPISELVLLDRERCIQCGRCTRFAAEVAGEAQIDFAGRGERLEVATFPTEPFSSYFAGNTVQICPVGALTATPYRFTARPWDLDQVESTCTSCALGCRVAVQSSANRLTRLLGIDSDPVNQGWLCDKGRYVFESVNGDTASVVAAAAVGAGGLLGAAAPIGEPVRLGRKPDGSPGVSAPGGAVAAPGPGSAGSAVPGPGSTGAAGGSEDPLTEGRLTEPLVRKDGELVAVSWGEALAAAAERLRALSDAHGPESIAVLGGARCTNEGAYAWAKLAKGVLGTDSVDAQLGDGLPAELVLGLPRATIDQACRARTAVLLTGDVREELPVLFLRLRGAVKKDGLKLVEVSQRRTSLTPYAAVSLRTRPGDAPAVCRALAGDGAALAARGAHPEGPSWSDEEMAQACELVGDGSGVVVLVGRPSLAESAAVVADAARALAAALPGARFLPTLRRGNVHGALDMGLAPGLLPGRVSLADGTEWFTRVWGSVPAATGRDALGVLRSLAGEATGPDEPAAQGQADGQAQGQAEAGRQAQAPTAVRGLVLLGADPEADFPDRQLAERALARAETVVLVAAHPSPAVDRADVVLPAATAHERTGTTTNVEGRVSRLGQKLVPPSLVWPDWMIAAELADALGADLGVGSVSDLWDEVRTLAPAYAGLVPAVMEAPAAHDGVLTPLARDRVARQPVIPIDPIALPGVESVEQQGAPPRVGLAEPPGSEEERQVALPDTMATLPLLALAGGAGDSGATDRAAAHVPPPDSYSLRLVSGRRLYDGGRMVLASPSVAALVPAAEVRANPYDLDRVGVGAGDPVRVRSARGALVLPAVPDAGVPRGAVWIDFNVPAPGDRGPANAAATLIDATAPVTDVRLESV